MISVHYAIHGECVQAQGRQVSSEGLWKCALRALPGDSRPPYKKGSWPLSFDSVQWWATMESSLQPIHQGSSLVPWCATTGGQLTSKNTTFIWYGFHWTWHRLAWLHAGCVAVSKLRSVSELQDWLCFRVMQYCELTAWSQLPHLQCIYLQFIVYVCFSLSATWPCKGFNFEGGAYVWRESKLYLIPNNPNICIWYFI